MPTDLNIAIWIILYMLCTISILFTYHVFQRHKQIKKELDEREENLKEYIEKIKQWSEYQETSQTENFKEQSSNRPITVDTTVEPACKVNTCG